MKNKMTIFFGKEMVAIIEKHCYKNECKPSQFIRDVIATKLGIVSPQYKPGNPNANKETANHALRALWGKTKKAKS